MYLNGIWDFAFYKDTALEEINVEKVDFSGVMNVPGCFEEFTSYHRGTAVYHRTFELEKEELRPVLRVEGAGQRVRFFVDGKWWSFFRFPTLSWKVLWKNLMPVNMRSLPLLTTVSMMKN